MIASTHIPPSPHANMGIKGPGLVLAVIQQRARHIQLLPRSPPHPLTAHRNASSAYGTPSTHLLPAVLAQEQYSNSVCVRVYARRRVRALAFVRVCACLRLCVGAHKLACLQAYIRTLRMCAGTYMPARTHALLVLTTCILFAHLKHYRKGSFGQHGHAVRLDYTVGVKVFVEEIEQRRVRCPRKARIHWMRAELCRALQSRQFHQSSNSHLAEILQLRTSPK